MNSWPTVRPLIPVIELNAHLQQYLPSADAFDTIMNWRGNVHREVKNRRTIEVDVGGKRFFAKVHRGVGWREVLKNWLSGRAPIVSAENEWRAIQKLTALGVPTMVLAAKGLRRSNPASLESFVVTEALEGMISLEDLTWDWQGLRNPRRAQLKRALLKEIARTTRVMHGAGLNHRDFYLCHFLVKDRDWTKWQSGDPLMLHLIDLHRVQQRARVPRRWLVKDLGGLLFSALDAGLTRRDLLRFIAEYRQRPWREALRDEQSFWNAVWKNAVKLYRPFHRREPPLHL